MSADRLESAERFEHATRLTVMQRVLDYLEEGRTDNWIAEKLGLGPDEYQDLKRGAMKAQVSAIRRKTTEEVYADYLVQQAACIRELTSLSKTSRLKSNLPALISAVRARSEILDKIIKMGQDFGIIERKPERKEIALGVVVAKLSNEELRQRILSELCGIDVLMKKFGDKNLLDLKPGKLHRKLPSLTRGRKASTSLLEPVDGARKSKTNRSRANKVHRGRKVVKK